MSGEEEIDIVKSFKIHEVAFRLVPAQLSAFNCDTDIEWNVVRFALSNANAIPDGRGVYAFVVEQANVGLPPHGYVMYIGKAGDGRSSLRKRFKSYFQEKRAAKRPRIYKMLNYWEQVLSFYFAEISEAEIQLHDIEIMLNDALLPPFSKMDFSANVRQAINAF